MLELQENLESRDTELSFDMSDRRLSPLQRESCLSTTVSDSESVVLIGCVKKTDDKYKLKLNQEILRRCCN